MNAKHLFSILVAVVIALMAATPDVSAQVYGRWQGLTTTSVGGASPGSTNAIVANTTNTFAVRLDCPTTDNVMLFTSFKLTGAGTSPVEFIIVPGTETGYATNNTTPAATKWNITANGTTGVAGVTNIAALGYPALWVISQGHNNANAVTNLTVSYGFKR